MLLLAIASGVLYVWSTGREKRARLAHVRRIGKHPEEVASTELTEVLHEAIELNQLDFIPSLVKHGADASSRSRTGELPQGALLRHDLDANSSSHVEAVHALFSAHFEIDAQIGAWLASGTDAGKVVENVADTLTKSHWRSAKDGSTVSHIVLEACRTGCISEPVTVRLMDTMLNQDPDLLTTPNIRKRTPTDIAMQCTGYLEVERRYTVVVFEHYQIITPDKPMYKSPTAEVHEAVDLRLSDASRAEGRLALKLIAGPHLFVATRA